MIFCNPIFYLSVIFNAKRAGRRHGICKYSTHLLLQIFFLLKCLPCKWWISFERNFQLQSSLICFLFEVCRLSTVSFPNSNNYIHFRSVLHPSFFFILRIPSMKKQLSCWCLILKWRITPLKWPRKFAVMLQGLPLGLKQWLSSIPLTKKSFL